MNIIASLCTELLIEMTPPPFCLGPSLPPLCLAVQRLPCMSGMDFWYWSGSLQKMVKASLFNIWARCSNSCSLELNRLREPDCVMLTRPTNTEALCIRYIQLLLTMYVEMGLSDDWQSTDLKIQGRYVINIIGPCVLLNPITCN